MIATVPVPFTVSRAVAFDYLLDPANRPQWQRSLRKVRLPEDTSLRPGLRWKDVTWVPGVGPEMRLVEVDRPRRWAETGAWWGFTARLTLDFAATEDGCTVTARFVVHGSRLGRLVTRLGARSVRADLRRAARRLSRGAGDLRPR